MLELNEHLRAHVPKENTFDWLMNVEGKVHRAMRVSLLPGVPSEERIQAKAIIEERERQTQLELEDLAKGYPDEP